MTDDVDSALARHVAEWHYIERATVERMVLEHIEMVSDLGFMIDDLYGERAPIPGDPNRRVGGRLTNGGVKVKVPAWMTAIITGSFLLLATIAGALITSLLT